MHLAPALEIEVLGIVRSTGLHEAADARIVDEHVQPPVRTLELREHPHPVVLLTDIQVLISRPVTESPRHRGSRSIVDVRQHDEGALGVESNCGRRTDAARSPRDERNPVL